MTAPVEAGEFYKVDSSRVTIREYWFETKNPLVLGIAGVLKALRVSVPSYTDHVPTVSLGVHRVELLPGELEGKVAGLAGAFEALGFGGAVHHLIEDPVNQVTTVLVTMLHGTGAIGRVHLRQSLRFSPPKEKVFAEILTPCVDGHVVWTISGKPDMIAPAECLVEWHVKAGVEELWSIHQRRVGAVGRAMRPVRNVEEMEEATERLQAALWSFHTGRGVFRPMKPAEAEAVAREARRREARAGAGESEASRHGDVLREIEEIQNKKGSWAGAFWLVVFTGVLFLAAGKAAWGWKELIYLVPILFVHELGHYLAMRAFGYRNLRMFFIPFFGAAVSGQHYNVAGWKKVVVSLAGPVPGIVLGILLGIWGLVNGKDGVVNVAQLAVIVNGFNLLPLMPLDGGHVMHALLFSRHYVLDVAFRVMAAVLLLGMGLGLGQSLIYVAIFMLVSAPVAYRVAKVAYDLRSEGASGVSPDGQSIPPALAERIVDRLLAGTKKPQNVKMLAQNALSVFEQMNARPPGAVGTIGLMGVHGGTFVAALVSGVVFLVLGSDVFRTAFKEGALMPVHEAPAMVEVAWRGEKAGELGAEHRTVVGTFESARAAKEAAGKLRPGLPATAELLLFGDSVIVMLPGDEERGQEAAVKALEAGTEDVYVETKEQYSSIRITGLLESEEAAKGLVEELDDALVWAGEEGVLTMPWQVGRQVTAEAYAGHRKARATVREVQQTAYKAYDDPAREEYLEKMAAARRRGNVEEAREIAKQRDAAMMKAQRALVEALRGEVGRLDGEVLEAMLAVPATQPWAYARALPAGVVKRLGVVEGGAGREGARGGYVRHNKLFVDLQLTLPDVGHALPEVVRWLGERGVSGTRYAFMEPESARGWGEEDEEEE